MIKLIAIDIDGTLVNEEKVLMPEVKEAINKAIAAGKKIVLCTGRPMNGIKPYLEELDFAHQEDFVISQNGGCITRTDTQEVVYERTMDFADLKKLAETFRGFPTGTLMVNEHTYWSLENELTDIMRMDAELVNMELVPATLDQFTEDPKVMKMLLMGTAAEVDQVDQMLPQWVRDEFYVVRSQEYLIEVMPAGIHKGAALEKLAGHLGFSLKEVMALGDGENDYEMIQTAGLGVVMENGTERLKAIANEITLSNEENGVAHAIEMWGLAE